MLSQTFTSRKTLHRPIPRSNDYGADIQTIPPHVLGNPVGFQAIENIVMTRYGNEPDRNFAGLDAFRKSDGSNLSNIAVNDRPAFKFDDTDPLL